VPGDHDVDYALVGGGLQNGLIALALRARQPGARIAMIERGEAVGGNHTWCFHDGDLPVGGAAWIDPLVTARWDDYDVAFPAHRRTVASGYACVSSARLAACVGDALRARGSALHLRTRAVEVGPTRVVVRTADGKTTAIGAQVVIDARGPDAGVAQVASAGWQKFVGHELRLTRPHGLTRPMLIDATVAQLDGFRFFYVLPLAPDRVLVEDTRFSDGAHLDVAALRGEIDAYVAARGWTVAERVREEQGVLPMPWAFEPAPPVAPLVAGYMGGWFHPVTGYSFPIAARLAAFVASRPADELFGPALDAHARRHRDQLGFAMRLARMMFRWFAPARRYHVLERFYRLPAPVIRRFYALELGPLDRLRIVAGRPPRGISWRAVLGSARLEEVS
jgi:lycopene beta-cyclase